MNLEIEQNECYDNITIKTANMGTLEITDVGITFDGSVDLVKTPFNSTNSWYEVAPVKFYPFLQQFGEYHKHTESNTIFFNGVTPTLSDNIMFNDFSYHIIWGSFFTPVDKDTIGTI